MSESTRVIVLIARCRASGPQSNANDFQRSQFGRNSRMTVRVDIEQEHPCSCRFCEEKFMKSLLPFLAAAFLLLTPATCTNPTSPSNKSAIVVFVFGGGSGSGAIEGKKVQLLQTGETRTTDSTGIAQFQVNPGTWTVRVYNLQVGGPVLHTVDSTITIKGGVVDSLRFFDCLMCV